MAVVQSGAGFSFQIEGIEQVIKKLETLRQIDKRNYNRIKKEIKDAAKPMKEAIKSSITDGKKKETKGYVSKGKQRNTGFKKELQVTYKPGNLRRSIDIFFNKRKTSLSVFVGARMGRKARANADGYYAGMVHYGVFGPEGKEYKKSPKRPNVGYVDSGYSSGRAATLAALEAVITKILNTHISRL
jgi:hypothetical protein